MSILGKRYTTTFKKLPTNKPSTTTQATNTAAFAPQNSRILIHIPIKIKPKHLKHYLCRPQPTGEVFSPSTRTGLDPTIKLKHRHSTGSAGRWPAFVQSQLEPQTPLYNFTGL